MKNQHTVTLQTLVMGCMAPRQPVMDDAEIAEWMERLPEIHLGMIRSAGTTMFGMLSAKIIRRHLSQIGRECTLMLDALHGYPEGMGALLQLQQRVTADLLAVLQHLQLNYSDYLDANSAMPKLLFEGAAKQLEFNTVPLVNAMTRYHADKRLQALVIGKMTGLLKNGSGTWHQVGYLERLQQQMLKICTGPVVNITGPLRTLLLRANFNTSGFLAWCKEEIEEKVAECFESRAQYDCLFHYQREYSALTDEPEFLKFEPRAARVKATLLEYVHAGLGMMDNKNRVLTEKKVTVPAVQGCSVPVSISVDVLAYLFRLLMNVGVMSGSKADLVLFISASFQTPGIGEGHISPKSIAAKYRQVVKNTATSVKSILLKMLKQLDDDFK